MSTMSNSTTTLKTTDIRLPVTTFLRDTFFPQVTTFVTEKIDVDFRKGGQKVAPFVAKNVGGINLKRDGYVTKNYETPRISVQKVISPEVLQNRAFGELTHSTMTQAERGQMILERDIAEMDADITRREELMAAQLLTTGIIHVHGYTDDKQPIFVDESIDFGLTNQKTLETTAKWDNTASKKYDDIALACEEIFKTGYNPTHVLLGSGAYKKLIADEKFMKLLDIKSYELGLINPQLKMQNGGGYMVLGRLNALGVTLYVYYGRYQNESNILTPYIADERVVVAPTDIGEYLYGAITQIDDDKQYHTYEGTRVPQEFADQSNNIKVQRLQSRPLAVPFDIDSFYSLKTY